MKGKLTLEYCLDKADANYPLLKKYGITEKTTEIALSDINKGWLPSIGVYLQGTIQNEVPTFPSALQGILDQMGQEIAGMGKLQYKLGVDVNQTIWDGGTSKLKREIARDNKNVADVSVEVQMYAIRQQVQSIYFAILLIDTQIKQSKESLKVLEATKKNLESMFENGVAMSSDVDMVEAQILSLQQKITEGENASESYKSLLSIYMGENVGNKTLEYPAFDIPESSESFRPELKLFENKIRLNETMSKEANVRLMPKIGLFAQGYYGYPGFNYFSGIMKRDMSFNIMAGVRVSWDITPFYTKNNLIKKQELAVSEIEVDREVFLFNSRLQERSERDAIDGMKKVMADDDRIVKLRANVRKAAESQLKNGTIDVTDLLIKINDETQAQLTAEYHKIELLQNIYKLKHTLNQ